MTVSGSSAVQLRQKVKTKRKTRWNGEKQWDSKMTAYTERDGYSALLFLFCCFQLLLCAYRSPAAEHVQTTAIRTARRAQSRPHRSLRSRIRPHCKRNLLRRIILRQLKRQKPRLLPTESRLLLRKVT